MKRIDTATRIVHADPGTVYRAHLEPDAVARWRAPRGMRGTVHTFEAREGGLYRMELEYEDASHSGKTTGRSDVFEGQFAELVQDERIVEIIRFQSEDPAFAAPIKMTTTLTPVAEGTQVTIRAEDVPSAIGAEDHAEGMASALENLAAYVEDRRSSPKSPVS